MRAATYRIAPAPGDMVSAECGVYFFGVGQGASVDADIERWKDSRVCEIDFDDPVRRLRE